MIEKDKKVSHVSGEGWGDCHTWYEFKFTTSENHILPYSTWKCRRCWAVFNHMYNYIPDIFTAMKACKVPNVCSRKVTGGPSRYEITGVRMEDKENKLLTQQRKRYEIQQRNVTTGKKEKLVQG